MTPKYKVEIEKAYSILINAVVNEMGYNSPKDIQNMKESPKRCAKGFLEIIKPLPTIKKDIQNIIKKTFDADYNGMILSPNMVGFSLCPHHYLPVVYRATIAYIPKDNTEGGKVLGVSKITRIFHALASRPVLQETLTTDIVDILSKNFAESPKFPGIESLGAACTLEAVHFCMACRGVRQHEARIVTQKLSGSFFNDATTRSEYVSFFNSKRPDSLL